MPKQSESLRVDIREASRIAGVSPDTIRRLIFKGELRADRIGKGPRAPIRIPVDALNAVIHPIPTVGTIRDGLQK